MAAHDRYQEQQTYDYWVGGSYYDHVTWDDWTNIADTEPKPTPVPSFHPFPHPTIVPFPRYTPLHVLPQIAMLPLGPDPVLHSLPVEPDTTKLTQRSLADLRSAPQTVLQRLGFANPADVASAQFGTPLREYVVGARSLASYQTSATPSSLLTGGTTLFYPVIAGDRFRSSVRVLARPGEAAHVIALGDTSTAAALESIPSIATLVRARSATPIPAVRVPALGLYFVGRVTGGKLKIAPTFDVPYLSLERGSFEDAAAVFARLAPFALKAATGTQAM